MPLPKFIKLVGTRICVRYYSAKQQDCRGLAHGRIAMLIRDDMHNLMACKVLLDGGETVTLIPSKLIDEKAILRGGKS